MKLQTSPLTAGGDQFLEAFCFSTDAVGDVVYVMGNKVGTRYQVTKVNINNITHIPAIGVIFAKPSATTCLVQTAGVLRSVYTGRTPQKPQFISLTSTLQETPPVAPTSGRRAVQIIALALSTEDLLIHVKSPIILVPT